MTLHLNLSRPLAVIAIGGNSLVADAEHTTVRHQWRAVRDTARSIVDIIEEGYSIVLTHGNGPQVGFILERNELASDQVHTTPLDVIDADTQGSIGYMIQQAIDNEFVRRGRTIDRQVVTLITQVEVDREDPAFDNPTKPVGSFLTPDQAEKHRERGHIVIDDSGRGLRRVVPSPEPQSIFELEAIEHLLEVGMIVICVGGGGIPIVRKADGTLRGVPAVIDKDLASSLLATELEADLFLISTAVEQVVLDFGSANPTPLDSLTTSRARQLLAEGQFPPGSMGPKIRGMCNFIDSGGSLGIITCPENFKQSLRGDKGTRFVPDPDSPKSSSPDS